METGKIIALIILGIVLLLVFQAVKPGGPLYEWMKQISIGNLQLNKVPTGYQPVGGGTVNTPTSTAYTYQLVDTTTRSGMDAYGKIYYNARLIRVYGDGRTEIVVDNFKNRFSDILLEPNHMLTEYYFPPSSDVLYFSFKGYYASGVGNRYYIYRYNTKTDEMRNLFSNKYLTSYALPSPFNRLFLLAVDDDTMSTYQRLYLVNLETDTGRILVQLGSNETLATSLLDFSGVKPPANLSWISANQIGYGVYRYQGGINVLKERRELSI